MLIIHVISLNAYNIRMCMCTYTFELGLEGCFLGQVYTYTLTHTISVTNYLKR